ncbi:YybH family protein [Nocardia alni]|uniref:YybH family protein n=1 Tax=Nocardia alni TaxID=2815723 RepID=UPI001C233381|nr:nuclear transport factor 2 family protein [Nocardia alni]
MSKPTPPTDPAVAADLRFFEALLTADHTTLDTMLAPDFLIVDVAAGNVTARTEFLNFVSAHAVQFTRITPFPDETVVRRFGTTTIVIGRTTMEFNSPDNPRTTTASRYTHVYTSTSDTLLLASAQGTPIPT